MAKICTNEEEREKDKPSSPGTLTLKASKRTLAFNRGMNAAARRQAAQKTKFLPRERG